MTNPSLKEQLAKLKASGGLQVRLTSSIANHKPVRKAVIKKPAKEIKDGKA